MGMQVVQARPWADYEAEGKTLLAQFGDYDVIRDGDQEPSAAEDYALARMAASAPHMHRILLAVAAGDDGIADRARDLLREIDDASL